MESLLIWGLALLALALVVLGLELFVPSGGVLGITAAVLAVAGVVCLFKVDTKWGAIGGLFVLVMGPAALFVGLKIWPHTPMGRRVIGTPTDEELNARREAEEAERRRDAAMIGQEGTVLTDLRPVGTVEIAGRRYDALSELMVVPRGARVRVTGFDGVQVRVRQVG